MEWCVLKMGIPMFDVLHAYGLGLLLAHVNGVPTALEDGGNAYILHAPIPQAALVLPTLLDTLLMLPVAEELRLLQLEPSYQQSRTLNILDGMLALLFTSPGLRVPSVKEVQRKSRYDATLAEKAVNKGRIACDRWKHWLNRQPWAATQWGASLLRDYDCARPVIPVFKQVVKGQDISLLMTLDPSFGYSSRQAKSDGLITRKTNVSIRTPCSAVLLAYIGAAHFLRAIPVKGDLVLFLVPLAASLSLTRETILPMYASVNMRWEQALLMQWMAYASQQSDQGRWDGVAYQTVQTQGAQQCIPRDRGVLDLCWCASVQRTTLSALFSAWRRMLSSEQEHHSYDIDALLDCLRKREAKAWEHHLYDVAICVHTARHMQEVPYAFEEIQEMTAYMNVSQPSKLAAILTRKDGTLRFGHALRLLGQVNAAALRDLVEALEGARTLDQLLLILAQIAQDCQIASAKSPFILVPSEEDLYALLEDVEQVSVSTVARFLITLSALRYPRLEMSEPDTARLARVNMLLLAALGLLLSEETHRDGRTLTAIETGKTEVLREEKQSDATSWKGGRGNDRTRHNML